jgi:hypothetical protein
METVSSSLTFLYKFIFTTVWSAGFGLGTVVMFLKRKPEAMQFAVAWAAGTAFLLLTCARLKRVKLDGATLVISISEDDIVTRLRSLAGPEAKTTALSS